MGLGRPPSPCSPAALAVPCVDSESGGCGEWMPPADLATTLPAGGKSRSGLLSNR